VSELFNWGVSNERSEWAVNKSSCGENMSNTDVSEKDIRKFGTIALVFFGSLSGLGLWTQKPVPTYLFGSLSVLGLGFILIPARLRPVYNTWLKVAHVIGRIITTLVLALAYYLVITPAALIKRLFGGRPLPMTPDKEATYYWVARTEPAQPMGRFLKRY
jgi:hypothetical protein